MRPPDKARFALRRRCALLRFKSWGQRDRGERALELVGRTLCGRYRVTNLFAVGGQGVLYTVECGGQGGERPSSALLKIPSYDWVRPGRVSVDRVARLRERLAREGEILDAAGGGTLPAFVDLISFLTPLVDEAKPRLAQDEKGLVMELIDGASLDEFARAARRAQGNVTEFEAVLAFVVVELVASLSAIASSLGEAYHCDMAPRNFLVERPAGKLRVVDAGAVVTSPKCVRDLMTTPAYFPVDGADRELIFWGEEAEKLMVKSLELLLLDLITDRIAQGRPSEEARREAEGRGSSRLTELFGAMRSGEIGRLQACRDAWAPLARSADRSAVRRVLDALERFEPPDGKAPDADQTPDGLTEG